MLRHDCALSFQRSDGSWPFWQLSKDNTITNDLVAEEPKIANFYNRLHPTWVAVQSLRDRNFEYDRKGNAEWGCFMERLLKQTNLRELENRVIYRLPTRKSSRRQAKVPSVGVRNVQTIVSPPSKDKDPPVQSTAIGDTFDDLQSETGDEA